MAKVTDVAAHMLRRQMWLDTHKLHQLLHHAQGWHLAWYGVPLFQERMEAWASGPVCPDLRVPQSHGTSGLTQQEQDAVDEVMRVYGAFSPAELAELTRMDPAWLEARAGCQPTDACTAEVTPAMLLRSFSPRAELGGAGEVGHGVILGLLAWHQGRHLPDTGQPVPTTPAEVHAFLRGDGPCHAQRQP